MKDVQKWPVPSQIDDFLLHSQMIGADIRMRKGDVASRKWSRDMEELAKEKEEFRACQNSNAMMEALLQYKVSVIEGERVKRNDY